MGWKKTETMSEPPKFEVIDRRKMKAEEEKRAGKRAAAPAASPRQVSRRPGRAWW